MERNTGGQVLMIKTIKQKKTQIHWFEVIQKLQSSNTFLYIMLDSLHAVNVGGIRKKIYIFFIFFACSDPELLWSCSACFFSVTSVKPKCQLLNNKLILSDCFQLKGRTMFNQW